MYSVQILYANNLHFFVTMYRVRRAIVGGNFTRSDNIQELLKIGEMSVIIVHVVVKGLRITHQNFLNI
jgi:hypothetical protein